MAALADPLKVMISGAPASGKGTQCELIKTKVSYSCMNSTVSLSVSISCPTCNPPSQQLQRLAAA